MHHPDDAADDHVLEIVGQLARTVEILATLVKDRREEKESNKWLLIKAGESHTLGKKADDTSAVSGRSMVEIAEANDAQWQSNRAAEKQARQKR